MSVDAYRYMVTDPFRRIANRISWQRTAGELMSKRWMDAIASVVLLIVVIVFFAINNPGIYSAAGTLQISMVLAEYGLLALAMTIALVGGGIDLSVGSVMAVSNAVCIIAMTVYGVPVIAAIGIALLAGLICGAINGILISYVKTRPFITTLVTLLLFHSVALWLDNRFTSEVRSVLYRDTTWTVLQEGRLLGFPMQFWLFVVIAIVMQVVLTRSKFGWRLTAVGSARTAARRAGMSLERIGLMSYILSGMLAALAGVFIAIRLQQTSQSTGQGMEFVALTAVIIGGVSLAGGKGTASRAVIGALVVTLLSLGMASMGFDYDTYNVVLAIILVVFAILDLKYNKNRDRALSKIFIAPARMELPPLEDINAEGSVWKPNYALTGAKAVGHGVLDGPEDVVTDEEGRMYCGDRRGWIWRFSGPDFSGREIFARVGGLPLGMVFDKDGNLIVCVGGMGLYSIAPDGTPTALATRTKRSLLRIQDDSAIRLADDLDIAPDGKIYFSDATDRFDGIEYMFDITEARPNGRLLCYDPATGQTTTVVKSIPFPNGVTLSHDGKSLLVNSTNTCSIWRYWLEGPKKGKLEAFATGLPGFLDNINRASDGTYWVAFVGMRSPAFDIALKHADFRRRMVRRVPQEEWLMMGLNTSCVFKINEEGEVLASYWDNTQEDHSVITSMHESDGKLFLGGLTNNRVGVVDIASLDTESRSAERKLAAVGNE